MLRVLIQNFGICGAHKFSEQERAFQDFECFFETQNLGGRCISLSPVGPLNFPKLDNF